MTVTLQHYIVLAAALFAVGLVGAVTSRSVLRVVLCVELMLNAVNLNLGAFALFTATEPAAGMSFIVFLIVVAAAEVGVALALVLSLSRRTGSVEIDSFTSMRG